MVLDNKETKAVEQDIRMRNLLGKNGELSGQGHMKLPYRNIASTLLENDCFVVYS